MFLSQDEKRVRLQGAQTSQTVYKVGRSWSYDLAVPFLEVDRGVSLASHAAILLHSLFDLVDVSLIPIDRDIVDPIEPADESSYSKDHVTPFVQELVPRLDFNQLNELIPDVLQPGPQLLLLIGDAVAMFKVHFNTRILYLCVGTWLVGK